MKSKPPDPIGTLVVFSRPQVERLDLGLFLDKFGVPVLPRGVDMADLMGTMDFVIDGYNEDPRELYMIPEVRRFYAHFLNEWPHHLYFCDLKANSLRIMMLCCVPSLGIVRLNGKTDTGARYEPRDLLGWLAGGLQGMNQMCERTDHPANLIDRRTRAVFKYFELPLLEA